MASGESVAVGVRLRPFNDREENLKAELCVSMDGPRTILNYKGKDHVFTFDESFWSHDGFEEIDGVLSPLPGSKYADQQRVFDTFGQRVLNNAWDGFHCCLFAYGQTGAGKSYSMVGYGKNKGIVPTSCEEIFRRIDSNDNPSRRFEISASMIEIYNETVQDLLILPQDRPTGGLGIHESKMLGVYVVGVRKTPVESYDAIEKVIDVAVENRTVGSTLMNATSSRAHTVLTIEFKQVEVLEGGKESVKLSMINLVDLAGSEKSTLTGAEGDRLKEGCAINKSLSALGNVIEKLAKKSIGGKNKDIMVPYRCSKLTRLLQNALGGSSKTIMICALSPASSNAAETLSTLRYADRAKKIKNNATVNEDPQEKLLREMKSENEQLKEMMASLSGGGSVDVVAMQARMEELAKAEDALNEMQRSFAEKVKEAKEVETAMNERGSKRSTARLGQRKLPHIVNLNEDLQLSGKLLYGFAEGKVTTIGNPFFDDDDDDTSSQSSGSSGSRSGRSSSGSSSSSSSSTAKSPDVVISGDNIYLRQATVVNVDGICYMNSEGPAAESTFINGVSVNILLARQKMQNSEKPPKQDRPKGIVLEHSDRVAFGLNSHMIFVFIQPGLGRAEHILLGGQYTKAREELRNGFMKRMRGLGVCLGKLGALRSAETDLGLDSRKTCPRCETLEDKLAKAHEELQAVRQKAAAGQERPQAPAKVSQFVASMRDSFEDAIGTLDRLQMELTSAKGRRVATGSPDITPLYSF